LSAFEERGIQVGRDIAAVSFDEFDWASKLNPPLTTVDQHVNRLGLEAADLLFELIANPRSRKRRLGPRKLPPTLVVRSSCGCRPEVKPLGIAH
jgi:DNA-binding LacI/PurR family transcriptional regulator